MTTPTLRTIAALFALLLLVGGCTLGRRSTTVAPPREEPSAALLTADLETLRHENAQLREQQAQQQANLDTVQRSLTQNQEEQRRYRESMTRNFDLLEQSVALTLSKTITADLGGSNSRPVAQPAAQPAPAMSASMNPAMGPAAAPQAAPTAAVTQPTAGHSPEPLMGPKPAAQRTTAQRTAMQRTALRMEDGAQQAAPDDADLLPPQSPRRLSAHPEAKPLYEKGFALFARKDYNQAVIVFENFLNRFPDDIYSDNAQFWIGESYMSLNRASEAEGAYRAVLRNYEHRSTLEGYKTPDAIYRLGKLAQNRTDHRRAELYYDTLVERFPDTSAGRKAQRELATLGLNTAAR